MWKPIKRIIPDRTKLKRWFLRFCIGFGAFGLLFFLLNLIFPLKVEEDYSTTITDSKGRVIHAFLNRHDKWRMKTENNEISGLLKKTILFKEDRHFYSHPGVNPLALVRSLTVNLWYGRRLSGASTISMQVVRLLEPRKRTYLAKGIEMFRALQLEWKYSKKEILNLYLNRLPYGSNIEGVKSAAILYFDKNPEQLSLAEIATLTIIPNRPNSLVPGVSNQVLLKERNRWLRKWERQGLFTPEEIRQAISEPLIAGRKNAPVFAPHLSLRLKSMHRKPNIHTFLEMNMQWKLEKIIRDYVTALYGMDIHNAACIVIDNSTGRVVSYVGSADFNNPLDGGQVNGAMAVRQPGSALKPLLYGLCFDKGLFTPQTVVADVPLNIRGYSPENYDQTFKGPVTVSYALENSLNIPAVSALNRLGKQSMIEKLVDCGFRQIQKDRMKLGLSLVLGGCGVTLEEMTGLFSVFARQGTFREPVYCNLSKRGKDRRILSEAASFMITDILTRISRPDLPVGFENSTKLPKIAWKTGTSYGRRDAWSIGYNNRFTVGVWVGNFSNRGVADLSGATIATPLLFRIFNTIDYNSENRWYSMPKGCVMRSVCSESGDLPGPVCEKQRMDFSIPLISPSAVCGHMQEFIVSADRRIVYCPNCQPATGYRKEWYRVLKPEIEAWYRDNNLAYQTLPPHNPECDHVFRDQAPVISFPTNGSTYYIASGEPEPLQLQCHLAPGVKEVHWYINDVYYTKCRVGQKVFFTPVEGRNKISCTDDKGRNSNIWIQVHIVKE